MVDSAPTSTRVSSPPAVRAGYRPDVDALRAVAILLVIAFHAGVPGFRGGFIGVDVFFVISGFVILRSLLDEGDRTGRVSWWAFYGRRFRRLAPAALLMIVVTLLAGMVLLNPIGEQQSIARSAIAAATSTSNVYFSLQLGDYFVPTYEPNVFLHTWSLSVEEQFYLGVPLLFVLAAAVAHWTRRDRRRVMIALIVAACAASLVSAVLLGRFAPTQAFYLPFGRVYELGIGALLAVVHPPVARTAVRRLAWLSGAAVLVGATVVGLPAFGFPGAWALLPTLATATMIWAHVTRDDPGARWLLSAPILGIGKVSYGWYLWHWPLLALAATWYLREPPVWVRLVGVMIALGFAELSYRYWEPRFRATGPHAAGGRRTVLTGLTAIAATCALALGCLWYADQVAREDRWRAAWHAKYDTAFPTTCPHETDVAAHPADAICAVTDVDPTRPSILVWGDSFAQSLLPGVVRAARGRPVNVLAATRGACPPYLPDAAPAPDLPIGMVRQRVELCRSHNAAARAWIETAQQAAPVRVLVAARWPVYHGHPEPYPSLARESLELVAANGPLLAAGTPALLTDLDATGVGVDVFGVSPELDRPGPECVTRQWRTFDCDLDRTAEARFWGGVDGWLRRLHGTLGHGSRFIDPIDDICTAEVCAAHGGGVINFLDTDHLSAAATERLSDQIAPAVDAVLDDAEPASRP